MPFYPRANVSVQQAKPTTVSNPSGWCPFCDRENLRAAHEVLQEDGPFLLIKNRFPSLPSLYQTVLVEDVSCGGDLSVYSQPHLLHLLQFAIEQWRTFDQSDAFTSAVLLKNHGPHSSASLHHPHMQILSFPDYDYRTSIDRSCFEGESIWSPEGLVWSVATQPLSEQYEFTIRLFHKEHLSLLGAALQHCTHYILNHLNPVSRSYNLAFYEFPDEIAVKVFVRNEKSLPSVLFLGYNVHQSPADAHLQALIAHIHACYPLL